MVEGDNQRVFASLDLKNLNVISPLGRGAKGVVFLVRSADGDSLALKTVLRQLMDKSTGSKKKSYGHDAPNPPDDNIASSGEYRSNSFEEDVLASLNHPLFPRLHGVLLTDQIVGYAIDYCPGRDLNTLRKRQTEKMFSDDIIRFYAAEIVLALEYLHGMGIVYRDLKPENVMIQESGHLMLVDFDLSTKLSIRSPETRRLAKSSPESLPVNNGRRTRKKKGIFSPLSMFCKSGLVSESDSVHPVEFSSDSASQGDRTAAEKSNSFVGTEEYLAPEVVSGNGHDFSVDWWCLGVMMYEMLYGATPFRGIDRKETYYRILVKTPDLVGEPTPLRDLIGKLLEKDPKKRISLEEIKGHEFFKNVDWDHVLEISRPPFIPPVEDSKGNLQIDVESFVREIFQVEDDEEKLDNKKYSGNKNKGAMVEGLNNPHRENEDFLVF